MFISCLKHSITYRVRHTSGCYLVELHEVLFEDVDLPPQSELLSSLRDPPDGPLYVFLLLVQTLAPVDELVVLLSQNELGEDEILCVSLYWG